MLSNRRFDYWLIQKLATLPAFITGIGMVVVIAYASFFQKNPLGMLVILLPIGLVTLTIHVQRFIWKTQASSILLAENGISGKPLLGKPVEILWSEVSEIVELPVRILNIPQTEIRSSDGKSLRFSDVLPRRKELIGLIRQHAPHARIEVDIPYSQRMQWRW